MKAILLIAFYLVTPISAGAANETIGLPEELVFAVAYEISTIARQNSLSTLAHFFETGWVKNPHFNTEFYAFNFFQSANTNSIDEITAEVEPRTLLAFFSVNKNTLNLFLGKSGDSFFENLRANKNKDASIDNYFRRACRANRFLMAKILHGCGARVETIGASVLRGAITDNNEAALTWLLSLGVNPNKHCNPYVEEPLPLHIATALNKIACVRILVNQKAKIDLKDKEGSTPLIIACEYGFYSSLQFFLLDMAYGFKP